MLPQKLQLLLLLACTIQHHLSYQFLFFFLPPGAHERRRRNAFFSLPGPPTHTPLPRQYWGLSSWSWATPGAAVTSVKAVTHGVKCGTRPKRHQFRTLRQHILRLRHSTAIWGPTQLPRDYPWCGSYVGFVGYTGGYAQFRHQTSPWAAPEAPL